MSTPEEKQKLEKQKEERREMLEKREKNQAKKVTFMRGIERGVVAVVHTVIQAQIAERCGATGIIVVGKTFMESISDENAGVGRAADPTAVKLIMDHVMIPTFARVSIGHEVEARVMQHSCVNGIEESNLLIQVDTDKINYHDLDIPVIASIKTLDEALSRIYAGAAALTTKCYSEYERAKEAGDPPNISNALETMDAIKIKIRQYYLADKDTVKRKELEAKAKKLGVPIDFIRKVIANAMSKERLGIFTVPFFAQSGIIHPIDAAHLMSAGYSGVITSTQVFEAANPERRMRSIVVATENHKNHSIIESLAGDHGVNHEIV